MVLGIEPPDKFPLVFYRDNCADIELTIDDVLANPIADSHTLLISGTGLSKEPSRSATLTALHAAKDNGAVLSYDPNLRLSLWLSADAARAGILEGWQHAQVIKVSEEELGFLSEENTLERAARALWHDRLRLLVVTQGKAGCTYFTTEASGYVPGFAVHPVDTTGAGDGFVAGILAGILQEDLTWDREVIEKALRLGNAVGALATTQMGAIPSLPTMAEAKAFLQRADKNRT